MRKEEFFLFSGFFFLLWGVFDIALNSSLYGFKDLTFIWFCSITLFLLAFGLILRNSMLLNSFLAMALLVQPFWIADYLWYAFSGTSLNGFASYVFQPNFTTMQMIDSFRHMFMIPFGFYAVFMVSKKDKKSYLFIPAFITALLGSSYFLGSEVNNTNCVFSPCVDAFGGWLSGFGYLLFFISGTIILSICINLIIDMALGRIEKIKHKKFYKDLIFLVFIILLAASFATIAAASIKFLEVPRYTCAASESCQDCQVSLGCKYFYGPKENQTLVYIIKNKSDKAYVCDIYLKISQKDEDYRKVSSDYFIDSGKKYLASHAIGNPLADAQVSIKPECKLYGRNY